MAGKAQGQGQVVSNKMQKSIVVATERRVQHGDYTLKLMDAIDASANSLARAYEEMSAQPFWVPELPLLN